MGLDQVLSTFDSVAFRPRTLELNFPGDLTANLSGRAQQFVKIAFGKKTFTVLDLNRSTWKGDPAIDFFFSCEQDVRVEILAFLTLFVHEYTHRVDFLISPFGLQYYAHAIREYWLLQDFFPRILDDPQTVEHVRFLAGLRESLSQASFDKAHLTEVWKELEGFIHISYAWGDVSTVKPIGKYIQQGWDCAIKGDITCGTGISIEPVTVLNIFNTFRVPGVDDFWYLRPLTIFETKAVVNSLLFIQHMLSDQSPDACRAYYEKVYLARKTSLPEDYFFLLDLGARLYDHNDFHSLLKQADNRIIRSTLMLLSAVCWYALQAPPHLKTEDFRIANPILRLWAAYTFIHALTHHKVQASCKNAAEVLLLLDQKCSGASFQKPIKEVIPDCCKIIDNTIELNQKRTWNPDIKKHFDHIFTLMRPNFTGRDLSYVSRMGMPDYGNPLLGCETAKDWEVTYDDYCAPGAVKEWFGIRTDLYFNLLMPAEDVLKRLSAHFQAFLLVYQCECGKGSTMVWVSRFLEQFDVKCGFCGRSKTLDRDECASH